jgi:hypothetical protein
MNECRRCGHRKQSAQPYGEHCERLVQAGVTALMVHHRKVTCRLAAELLTQGGLVPLNHTVSGRKAWSVQSSRDPNVYYIVTDESCTCPAAQYHNNAVLCRHRLAAVVLAA